MNRNFLEKYHQELKNFREASKEFAKEHPAVAGHLGLLAPEIEDPYVERLIEAVSFLTARINLKIDEQYPKFLEHIFQVIQPSFNKVIPSCAIVSCYTNENTPFIIPAQSSVFTHAKKRIQLPAIFLPVIRYKSLLFTYKKSITSRPLKTITSPKNAKKPN
ncbi:type VI secretion system baseplate subunit TssF [Moraxella bovis]|uniref:type VI secretion system baseplate subunit TssF n=1 Tax=Moraxella bovis TaxID=476 RepID=UPI003B9F1848